MSTTCYNCFREKSSYGPCSFCGYDPEGVEKKYPLALKAGSILNGRYIVGRPLGQGGFGITYIARDYQTGERVAIKEYFPSELAGRGHTVASVQVHSEKQQENYDYGKAQFLEEARTLAAFNGDEHIVRIHSYFEENNTAYFVMEYVDGYALDQYMAKHGGKLSPREACRLLLPLMQSLGAVHAKGIIHRDIAPDNILITTDGTAKLIDFGAARYSTGEKSKSLDVVLKHGFAPKEQYLRRGRQGPFTDIYALAATFYYAITGKVPPESIERMDEDNLIPPSALGVRLPEEAEDALFKALEVNAQDRYQNMEAFHRAMASAFGDTGSAVPVNSSRREPSLQFSTPVGNTGFGIPQTGLSPREEAALLEKRAKEILAEEERKEREERERLARIEAEKREQERREREAREEAERLERERREREAREEAERKRREAREAEERRKQEAREAAERKRQEAKVEAERLKKERAEQKAREEAARQEKLRQEKEKREEEKRLAAEKKKQEAEEKERLRQEALAKQKAEQERKRQEAEQKKAAKAEAERLKKEQAAARKQAKTTEKSAEDTIAPTEGKAKKSSGKKPLIAVIAAVLVIAVAAGYFLSPGQTAKRKYTKAVQLMENGQYAEAAKQFQSAGNYEDAEQQTLAAYYAEGLALKEAEDWDNAVAAFTNSGDYGDARTQIQEIKNEVQYREATGLFDKGQYGEALDLYKSLSALGYKDSQSKISQIKVKLIANSEVGDSVYFGSYEQDNDLSNGKEDIEWLVLSREDDRILVISRYALDYQPFDDYESKIHAWETCSLRKWLNTDFMTDAFSTEEQNCIPKTLVTADEYSEANRLQGRQVLDTIDQVFLLSCAEVDSLFTDDNGRLCSPTAYTVSKGNNIKTSDSCAWWLRTVEGRSPFLSTPHGIIVCFNGGNITGRSVRPAMWINTHDVQAASSYAEGLAQKEAKNWESAILAFEKAGDYLDSQNQIAEIRFLVELQNLSASQVGDTVFFGSYEQDNDLDNGQEPIEWLVLDVQDGRSLLISKYALDGQPYNSKNQNVTWETSTLRNWLNQDFLKAAFSEAEQDSIITADVENSDSQGSNSWSTWSTDGGKNTKDKVFLLSYTEAQKYFSSKNARRCNPTAYAIAQNVYKSGGTSGNCRWWLRTSLGRGVEYVYTDGFLGYTNSADNMDYSNNMDYAVRPAMWIDLPSA